MALQRKKEHDTITLQAVLITVNGALTVNGSSVRLPLAPNGYTFVLDLTNAATDNADKLDVYVQTRIDDGSGAAWHDVVHFPQIAGDGTDALQYIEKLTMAATEAGYESTNDVLGVGTVRNIAGDEWRVRYVQIDGDTDATFTFSVTVCAM